MAKFSFFFLLASLLCSALATVPGTVYRADTRSPDKIKAAGGFKGFGTNQAITVIEHVKKLYTKGHRQGQDPWVSTSASPDIGTKGTVDKPCWVYTISTSGISSSFTDVAAAFAAAKTTNGHASEEEWASNAAIPLSDITSFYYLKKDLTKGTVFTWASYEAAQKAKEAKKAKDAKKASRSTASAAKRTSQDDTLVAVAFQA